MPFSAFFQLHTSEELSLQSGLMDLNLEKNFDGIWIEIAMLSFKEMYLNIWAILSWFWYVYLDHVAMGISSVIVCLTGMTPICVNEYIYIVVTWFLSGGKYDFAICAQQDNMASLNN